MIGEGACAEAVNHSRSITRMIGEAVNHSRQ